MNSPRFFHFTLNGRVISIAARDRDEAKRKYQKHLGKPLLSRRTTSSRDPHPEAHRVIGEEVEDLDEALNLQQRRERAMILRRNQMKIQRARELAQRKLAGSDKIKKRAYIQARDMVRRRVAGKRGADYEKLGPSEKIIVDQAVEKKKKLIKKIALRLIPKVQRAEHERLKSFLHGEKLANHGAPEGHTKVTESINSLFNEQFPIFSVRSQNPKANITADDHAEMKKRIAGKKVPGNENIVMYSKFSEEAMNETAAFRALCKKAEKSGIDLEVLGEVFDRGYNTWSEDLDVTPEQRAFARVNSFISGGVAYTSLDADLQEVSKETLHSYLDKVKGGTGKQYKTPLAFRRSMEAQGIAKAKLGSTKKGLPDVKVRAGNLPKGLKRIKTDYERQMDDAHRHIYKEGFKNWSFELKPGDRTKVLSGDHKGKKGVVVAKHEGGASYTIKHPDNTTMRHHISTLHEPIREEMKLDEARPVNNPEYDESEKAWNSRRKDWEKNFNPDGSPKKPKSKLKESRFHNTYMNSKATSISSRLNNRNGEAPKKDKWKVTLNMKDGSTEDHHVDAHDFHDAVMRAKETNPAREFHPLGKHKAWKLSEGLEEGTMKPYVKPHVDSSGKHVGWKSANKYGKVKYWQMFAKDSAHKHAGINLKEGCDKNTMARKRVQTVERPDNTAPKGDKPTSTRSVMHKHQQLVKKIVEQQVDPKKREVGTDSLVQTYKNDTPGQNKKKLDETAFSSDKKPVVIPAHKDEHGNTIPARTVMRRTKRALVNKNDNPNDGN